MRSTVTPYQISVIIPVLNEADGIHAFLQGLALQRDVGFEVVICDGGSEDGTVKLARGLADTLPFPLLVIRTERGRGRQLNAGVRASHGEYLLFLHADSGFRDSRALRKGLDALEKSCEEEGHHRVAGHFPLRFRRHDDSRSLFYYYLECKARLDAKGCIHGDQGFLLNRRFFCESGPFDESCVVMEDTCFADTIRNRGRWILLSDEIITSARRFETEGEGARQFLNAILMTLRSVGREDFISRLQDVYACQQDAGRLRILSFLDTINRLLNELTRRERLSFWSDTGRYVCENAWQVAFAMDVRRNFRKGMPPGKGELSRLKRFDGRWRFLAVGPWPPVAAFLAWLMFHCLRMVLGLPVSRSLPRK
jgi:rSAM/selenodomain-associated transferase 2